MRTLLCVALVGCSSTSSPPAEPLVSGSVAASYAGTPFTPGFGFATIYMGEGLIGFADGNVHCRTENPKTPPAGSGVIVQVPTLAVGSYPQASVFVFSN